MLIPLACCGNERAAEPSVCHRAAIADHCPMRAADGTPCPMHRQSSDGRLPTLRGTCSAAAIAVAVLLQPGVAPSSMSLEPSVIASALGPMHALVAARAVRSPDAPPPRT
jgi:hypothetical protein